MKRNERLPKKYEDRVEEMWYEDGDGWWAACRTGWMVEATGCHTAHGETKAAMMAELRTLAPCHCEECTGRKTEDPMTAEAWRELMAKVMGG